MLHFAPEMAGNCRCVDARVRPRQKALVSCSVQIRRNLLFQFFIKLFFTKHFVVFYTILRTKKYS